MVKHILENITTTVNWLDVVDVRATLVTQYNIFGFTYWITKKRVKRDIMYWSNTDNDKYIWEAERNMIDKLYVESKYHRPYLGGE